jgi:hypothetical protein
MSQIIKIKRGSGSPVSLQNSELAFDKVNKSLLIGTEEGIISIGGEHTFAKKTFVNDAVQAEADLRSAADSTLTTNLNNEISRATAAEGVISAGLAQELLDRAAAVSAEAALRVSGDSALDAKILTEKGRIDAILALSDTDKDSLKELVDLIQSIDTANDQAFGGYVTSNNAALAQEISDRQSGDSTLDGKITTEKNRLDALTTRVSAAEQDILDEVSDRQSAISGEQTARANAVAALEAADETLQDNIDAEQLSRSTADTSLSNRITALEGASADSRLSAVEADVADHETRISALETTIDGGSY